MRVVDVMTDEVITVRETTPFKQIVNILIQNKISGVPVVDDTDSLVGIISEKDLLLRLFPEHEDFYKTFKEYYDAELIRKEVGKLSRFVAQDLMTNKVITVQKDEPVLGACALMLVHNIRRLPVVEENHVIGIVTTNDLYKKCLTL
ncbi:CBS domain-containing protein [candidate division WWE3 bacterium]|nr:CBS domain-containing protein [candidate division WWE3 bacterium]